MSIIINFNTYTIILERSEIAHIAVVPQPPSTTVVLHIVACANPPQWSTAINNWVSIVAAPIDTRDHLETAIAAIMNEWDSYYRAWYSGNFIKLDPYGQIQNGANQFIELYELVMNRPSTLGAYCHEKVLEWASSQD